MALKVVIPIPPPQPTYVRPIDFRQKHLRLVDHFVSAAGDGDLRTIIDYILNPRTTSYLRLTVNSTNSQGYSALHVAYTNGQADVCAYLVLHGADIYQETKEQPKWSPYELGKTQGGPLFTTIFRKLEGKVLKCGECSICECSMALYPIDCGHAFCIDCLTNWFSALVDQSNELTCPCRGCNAPLQHNHFSFFLPSQKLITYLNQCLKRALGCMQDFVWCPHCLSGGFQSNDCVFLSCRECGSAWCKDCGQASHNGLTCKEAILKCEEDVCQCADWMAANTKACPQCKTRIEKNGGCSHVRCRHCTYEFCWICLGKYIGKYTHGMDCPCK